eukprot:CAMPEP_0168538108 /NCGR_PEP_ID=MMETSP0405-20121227/20864_1 /TAXON_ID=498012 /ORGANISM="Trichosphaerium sp, Strain Am-I-7 wt" /LENGTH=98 /DNA_ID=CAMNT_0008567073 /DNA_START=1236 /DNA_END=1528 /DNA_ORIENTATION=-
MKEIKQKREFSRLSAIEQHICKQIEDGEFLQFFPIRRAAVLDEEEDKEDIALSKLRSKLDEVEYKIGSSMNHQDRLKKLSADNARIHAQTVSELRRLA